MPTPLAPTPSDTRQRLIDAAAELFWERGYAATGLSDILLGAGARGGSLYHFFPTKDDLLLAVIQRQARVLETTIENALAAHDDPREKALALVGVYARFMDRTGATLGCPLTNLAGEIADTHPAAAAEIAAFNARIAGRIAECVRESEAPRDAGALGVAILALVQGATTQARASKSVQPLRACRVTIETILGADRPPTTTPVVRTRQFATR